MNRSLEDLDHQSYQPLSSDGESLPQSRSVHIMLIVLGSGSFLTGLILGILLV